MGTTGATGFAKDAAGTPRRTASPSRCEPKNGDHLKARDTSADVLERAYARYLLGQQEQARRLAVGDTTPDAENCPSLPATLQGKQSGIDVPQARGVPVRLLLRASASILGLRHGAESPQARQGRLPARRLWRKTRRPAYPDGRATMARQAPNLGQRARDESRSRVSSGHSTTPFQCS